MRVPGNHTVEEIDTRQRLFDQLTAMVMPAIERLGRSIRGEDSFADDRQLRACVAAARLATLLLAPGVAPEPPRRLAHPDHSDEEVERLLDLVEYGAAEENDSLA